MATQALCSCSSSTEHLCTLGTMWRCGSHVGTDKRTLCSCSSNTGPDVHAKDDEALRDASARGHVKVVQLLIQHGADVKAEHDAAMRLASEFRQTSVVQLLIQHGAVAPTEPVNDDDEEEEEEEEEW